MSARGHHVGEVQLWSETDFNWAVRQALMRQGYRAMHMRETDQVGVSDLIVYSNHHLDDAAGTHCYTLIDAWLELKIGSDWTSVRPAQREFMRDHWRMNKNAMFVLMDLKKGPYGCIRIRQGDEKGAEVLVNLDPYKISWTSVFEKFKARKS